MAETSSTEHLEGHAHGGPCDGKVFLHTAEMRRVKISDSAKPPKLHIYVFHEALTQEQGRRVYLWEKLEPWKFGG